MFFKKLGVIKTYLNIYSAKNHETWCLLYREFRHAKRGRLPPPNVHPSHFMEDFWKIIFHPSHFFEDFPTESIKRPGHLRPLTPRNTSKPRGSLCSQPSIKVTVNQEPIFKKTTARNLYTPEKVRKIYTWVL
jgi:hypothetical protein